MSLDLSPRVRQVLANIELKLKQEQQVTRPAQQDTMQQLQSWCERHDVDTQGWFTARTVLFDIQVLQRIERTLNELGLASALVDLASGDRITQSDSGDGEYKSVGATPTQQRVLMAQVNCGSYFPEWVTQAPSQWVMDIDWRTLELHEFSDLLIVENRDIFYEYFALHPQRYQLPERALNALVVYRGDADESKGCKALREAWLASAKPLIYFGDYDSAGLNFAVNGGYTHIMLPMRELLLARANAISQDAKQIDLAASVSAFAQQLPGSDPLRELLLHNTLQQQGLRQQAFSGALQVLAIART